jgi:Spy/CpxP family protein refolding chaperone
VARKIIGNLFIPGIVASVLATASGLFAQQSAPSTAGQPKSAPSQAAISDASPYGPDQTVQLYAQELKLEKKRIVAANMDLTEAEAEKFWPVYDRYAADLAKIYDTKLSLVQEYIQNYDTMNGDEAESYIRRRAAVEEDVMQLRLKYVPEFRQVLTGRQTALFFQIEWRLDLMVNSQLAQAPVINP